MTVLLSTEEKRACRVLTPEALASALCHWAVRSASDAVLDLGVGEGAFSFAVVERLGALGAPEASAPTQVYGAEYDPAVFRRAQLEAEKRIGSKLPNVVCADFYEMELPAVVPWWATHHIFGATINVMSLALGSPPAATTLLVLPIRTVSS